MNTLFSECRQSERLNPHCRWQHHLLERIDGTSKLWPMVARTGQPSFLLRYWSRCINSGRSIRRRRLLWSLGVIQGYSQAKPSNRFGNYYGTMASWRLNGKGQSNLGNIDFGSQTVLYYRNNIEYPFLQYHLNNTGNSTPTSQKATVFFSGKNEWKQFHAWPPTGTHPFHSIWAKTEH